MAMRVLLAWDPWDFRTLCGRFRLVCVPKTHLGPRHWMLLDRRRPALSRSFPTASDARAYAQLLVDNEVLASA